MPTANENKVIQEGSEDTVGTTYTDAIDTKGWSLASIYAYVSNGSATPGHNITFTPQGCDRDASDNDEWYDLIPQVGGSFTALTTIDGTGGTTPWPHAQGGVMNDFPRYIRFKKVVVTGGTWNYRVSAEMKQVN